jgi:hypothetical protein
MHLIIHLAAYLMNTYRTCLAAETGAIHLRHCAC